MNTFLLRWNRNMMFMISLALMLAGCATWQAPAVMDDASIRARAAGAVRNNVRVQVAVLSSEESERMFGASIGADKMQPVWIEVRNGSSQTLWLLRSGTDPDYFSPREVAWSLNTLLGGANNERMSDYLNALGFKNPVPPGETHAGILFTNPDRGTKLVNIDLFGDKTLIPFTLYVRVPDDASDPRFAHTAFEYPRNAVKDCHTLEALRSALVQLPCCATNADGSAQGDPLNAVLVGEFSDIAAAVVRRNYRRNMYEADAEQHLFGRAPDAVARKQAQAGAPATWLRVWLAPIRYQGRAVYVVQIGRPAGGRFARPDAERLVLHEDVDEARNFVIQDMMYSGGLERLGFVSGVGPATRSNPRNANDEEHYYTDGLRAVLFFATRPIAFSNIEMLGWEPFLERGKFTNREADNHARTSPKP
jgi:hypothetical protein